MFGIPIESVIQVRVGGKYVFRARTEFKTVWVITNIDNNKAYGFMLIDLDRIIQVTSIGQYPNNANYSWYEYWDINSIKETINGAD